jgi:predicted dehydrogenase
MSPFSRVLVLTATTGHDHARDRLPGHDHDPLRWLRPLLTGGTAVERTPDSAALDEDVVYDLIVVEGVASAWPVEALRNLRRRVETGALLLALGELGRGEAWSDLHGCTVVEVVEAELFARLAPSAPDHLRARTPAEIRVDDRARLLEPTAREAVPVLTVDVRFAERPVLVERRLGRGRVLVCGLGGEHAAPADDALGRVLRRLLLTEGAHQQRELGLAVVGYGPHGGMGTLHGRAATAVDGLSFVAAADPSAERRKVAEQDFPGLRAYADAEELLTDDAVDVVVVATPPIAHAGLALGALRAGRHVVVEKPLCLTTADADALLTAAADAQRVLTVHQNRRWDPDFLAVRRAVEGGLLGEVFNVETFVGGFEHPCRAWHSEVSVSGGAVYDWGSHHLDWIVQLLGAPPAEVQTTAHKRVWRAVTNLDQLRVRMRWADGREAQFLQSDVMAIRPPKVTVQGTAGTLVGRYRPLVTETVEPVTGYVATEHHHAEAPAQLELARYEPGWGVTRTALPLPPADRLAFHTNLADHLLLGEPLAVDPRQVRDGVALLEAAQRSSDEGGRTVTPSIR